MHTDGLDDHPDLRDAKWIAEADKRARREFRKQRRAARVKANGGRIVTAIAVVAIAALLFGLYREGTFAGVEEALSAPAEETFRIDPERPFRNTPADGWADGEAGVAPPAATPVGGFTAEQVAAAYRQVKQAVVTSRLERSVIQDHDVERYIGLLAHDLQDQMRQLFDGRHDAEASMAVTRIAKGQRLLPAGPKVNGTMTAEAGQPGELVVRTNYVFAYAFETDKTPTSPMDVVVVRRVTMTYVVRSGDTFAPESNGLWTDDTDGYDFSIACEAAKQGFLAPGISERPDRADDTGDGAGDGPSEDYFDPNRSLEIRDSCG
ncbi:hypothetical protein ABZ816_27345 [Actinosynnema sp. NPDC047251]|uniref:Putative membrane protein n=1 Tax=Saccharothrix espanaensis (strain ATCC 51144 / DSM 44229 / JCM 9112 / NBRC 15066 / NRRL 15764) TaxID=1179773 RepID=K0JT64_SACES|nr:hypothetical protein [Saccharothrix espanaensis]CCH28717.1 putative membrane protein [Saccharothrix espanaensis DSM 44229]